MHWLVRWKALTPSMPSDTENPCNWNQAVISGKNVLPLFEKLKDKLGETSQENFPARAKNDLITLEREQLADQSSKRNWDVLLLVTPDQLYKLLETREGSVLSQLYLWVFTLLPSVKEEQSMYNLTQELIRSLNPRTIHSYKWVTLPPTKQNVYCQGKPK